MQQARVIVSCQPCFDQENPDLMLQGAAQQRHEFNICIWRCRVWSKREVLVFFFVKILLLQVLSSFLNFHDQDGKYAETFERKMWRTGKSKNAAESDYVVLKSKLLNKQIKTKISISSLNHYLRQRLTLTVGRTSI